MKTKNKDIACVLTCWQGRKVLLHKSTLVGHIARFHYDSLFVVDALKRNFHRPICVIRHKAHGTLNAFYDIEVGEQPFLMVAVKFQQRLQRIAGKPHFVKTIYGVKSLPQGPYEWERKS